MIARAERSARIAAATAAKPWVPTRGGDGGSPARPAAHASANGERVLCGRSLRDTTRRPSKDPLWLRYLGTLEVTTDRSDAAHGVFEERPGVPVESDRLLPATSLLRGQALPRLYPSSQMVGRTGGRVSIDSSIDSCFAAAAPFENAGIPLGWSRCSRDDLDALRSLLAEESGRDLLRPRLTQRLTERERSLEKQATAMLARAAVSRESDGVDLEDA
ncbi:MAG: hypothetical protein AAGI53_09605 [Planctomycetota bacterium]